MLPLRDAHGCFTLTFIWRNQQCLLAGPYITFFPHCGGPVRSLHSVSAQSISVECVSTFAFLTSAFPLGGNVISRDREHGRPTAAHCRGVWSLEGCSPRKFFLSVLRCNLVHSEAYTEKHTELLEKRLIIIIIIAYLLSYGTLETIFIG